MSERHGEVTIRGGDSGDYLRFTPLLGISLTSFEVTASIRGRVVTNNSLCLLAGPEFVTALREFERTRSGEAVLVGTYDFRLRVGACGSTGAAWVGFELTDAFPLSAGRRGLHVLNAGILVDGEYVAEMVRDLAGLLEGVSHS